MKRVIIKTLLLALPLAIALPASAYSQDPEAAPEAAPEGEPAGADVEVPDEGEPTEAEALEDDILLVIDLPIAADEARAAGVEEADIGEALDAAAKAEVSAGDMAEVLIEEATETKAKGKRAAFGQWVKQQIAEGKHGKELAAAIKERKAELAQLSDEEKAAIEAKLAKLGEKRRDRKKKLHELRKKLHDEGKMPMLAGKERHDALIKAAGERHAAAKAEWAKHKHHHGGHGDKADKLEDKADKLEDKQDELEDKQDKLEDKHDAAHEGGKADKLEDKQDKLEDKQDKLEDKKDKLEDKKDAHDGHKGHGKGEGKGGN